MTNNIQNIPNKYARDQKYSCCKIEGQEAEESMMKIIVCNVDFQNR
jgi:hypothetical protein